MSGGTKHDVGKIRFDLFPPDALTEIGEILTFGAEKYSAHNWTKGFPYSRLFAACMRHLWAWWRGEDLDPESGKSHLAHAGCCLIFMLEMRRLHPELDDRFPWKKSTVRNSRQTWGSDFIFEYSESEGPDSEDR